MDSTGQNEIFLLFQLNIQRSKRFSGRQSSNEYILIQIYHIYTKCNIKQILFNFSRCEILFWKQILSFQLHLQQQFCVWSQGISCVCFVSVNFQRTIFSWITKFYELLLPLIFFVTFFFFLDNKFHQ